MGTVAPRPTAGHADTPRWAAHFASASRNRILGRLWNALRHALESDTDAGALARAAAADPADTLRYAVLADFVDERPFKLADRYGYHEFEAWWPAATDEVHARLAAGLRWCHAAGKRPDRTPGKWGAWHWYLGPVGPRWTFQAAPASTLDRAGLSPRAGGSGVFTRHPSWTSALAWLARHLRAPAP